MDKPLPSKKAVFDALLAQGAPHVYVHFDPRFDNVLVPEYLVNQAQLVLAVGHQFTNPPILNLKVDDLGIYGVFSIKGKPEQIFIPWQRVFALVEEKGKGMVWSADMPQELKDTVYRDQELRGTTVNSDSGEERVIKARKDGRPLRYVRQENVYSVDFKSHGASFPTSPSDTSAS